MSKTFIYPPIPEEKLKKIIEDAWNTFSKEEQDEMLRKLTVLNNLKILRNANNEQTN